jgi:hypothetical protein
VSTQSGKEKPSTDYQSLTVLWAAVDIIPIHSTNSGPPTPTTRSSLAASVGSTLGISTATQTSPFTTILLSAAPVLTSSISFSFATTSLTSTQGSSVAVPSLTSSSSASVGPWGSMSVGLFCFALVAVSFLTLGLIIWICWRCCKRKRQPQVAEVQSPEYGTVETQMESVVVPQSAGPECQQTYQQSHQSVYQLECRPTQSRYGEEYRPGYQPGYHLEYRYQPGMPVELSSQGALPRFAHAVSSSQQALRDITNDSTALSASGPILVATAPAELAADEPSQGPATGDLIHPVRPATPMP